jgi:pimeloyl-ACP methyl ester carboxylesterase
MKHAYLTILILVCLLAFLPGTVQAASAQTSNKEINFVYLHGYTGTSADLQLLSDNIESRIPTYIANYQNQHSGITVSTDALLRSYPNTVDINTWAINIAEAVNVHFAGKKNLVLVGHSMGGKAALYAVAHNIGNIADKVAMVVTINSPITSLGDYYYVGGDTPLDFWGAQKIAPNQGVLGSLINYDSSEDGKWVGTHKHWIAFVSAESNPLSDQFNTNGVDPMPRNMDDTIVPISGQYADGADVIYYGQYSHSDFTQLDEVSGNIAEQILNYIFGGSVQRSVLARSGSFEHKAGLLPGTVKWDDLVGGVLANNGTVTHFNDSYFKWQSWEDVVGNAALGVTRSSYQTVQTNSSPIFTGLTRVSWAGDSAEDGRIVLRTRAAPRSTVQVDWSVYQVGLLPQGIERDHYEVEISTGTPYSSVGQISWKSSDLRDLRLVASSQAQSPFRWFNANWRVYYKESVQRQILDDLPADTP